MDQHDCSELPDLVSPLRILLLGFGNVARAFIPLLASRVSWLEQTTGIHPYICGIGTRSQGFLLDPTGVDVAQMVHEPVSVFSRRAQTLPDVEAFLQAGKACGASLLIE